MLTFIFHGSLFKLSAAAAENEDNKINAEYKLKAAFIYNFMKFVEWPDFHSDSQSNKSEKNKETVVLGVLGENHLKDHLNSLSEKTIKDRPVKIVIVDTFEAYKKKNSKAAVKDYYTEIQKIMSSCHLLFVGASEKERVAEILKLTEKMPVLTVSDISHFAEAGGVIEFVTEKNKIQFNINTVSAEAKKLKISSQLLQLARKVYKKEIPKS
ncbi:MAG: YfiR family protein [Sedimentisphaerales bacterium]|nr:YfiR family protein [Sedimentisphaerales bacterium]